MTASIAGAAHRGNIRYRRMPANFRTTFQRECTTAVPVRQLRGCTQSFLHDQLRIKQLLLCNINSNVCYNYRINYLKYNLYFNSRYIIAKQHIKEIQMKYIDENPASVDLRDRLGGLSASERIRAEAALRRGEFLADLMLRGISAVRNAIHRIKQGPRVKPSSRLGPTA